MIETLRRIVQSMHHLLEVMPACVLWYAAYPLS
jgi:hypothetical protein